MESTRAIRKASSLLANTAKAFSPSTRIAPVRRFGFQSNSRPFSFSSNISRASLSPVTNTYTPSTSSRLLQAFRRIRSNNTSRRYNSSQSPNPTPHLNSPEPSLSLGQRLKKLSREYGYSAVGVYFALSALDFPFCFLAVRLLGPERVGHWEHVAVEGIKNVLRVPFPTLFEKKQKVGAGLEEEDTELADAQEAASNGEATLWTQLVLAYAIHKSFIFIRVPLTAAVTPKVVKTLRGWGWDIGKRKPKTGTGSVPKNSSS